MQLLSHLVLALAAAQDPPVPAPVQQPDGVLESPEAAAQVFEQVAAAQFPEGKAAPVRGYYVKLNFRERGETVREFAFDHWYRADHGGMVRQALDDVERKVRVEKGFDGRRFWLVDEQGNFEDLSGREFKQDRDAIDEAIVLSQRLLLLLDLEELRQKAHGIQLIRQEEVLTIFGNLRHNEEDWSFILELSNPDLLPMALRLDPPVEKDPEKRAGQPGVVGPGNAAGSWFVMKAHGDFEGRRVPRVIEVFGDERSEYPDQIFEIRQLRWREPPPEREFQPPQ